MNFFFFIIKTSKNSVQIEFKREQKNRKFFSRILMMTTMNGWMDVVNYLELSIYDANHHWNRLFSYQTIKGFFTCKFWLNIFFWFLKLKLILLYMNVCMVTIHLEQSWWWLNEKKTMRIYGSSSSSSYTRNDEKWKIYYLGRVFFLVFFHTSIYDDND